MILGVRMRWPAIACALVVALAVTGADARSDEVVIEGTTMGTTYAIRVARFGAEITRPWLKLLVEDVLERVDGAMSTYREDSELRRFNRHRGTDWVAVSQETASVALAARDLALRSHGAFDPTVGALVRLWGFGPGPATPTLPPKDRVDTARRDVGVGHFSVRESPPALRKTRSELELDLSGIAKGYAVDAIAERLLENGVSNFLIEIGGEIHAKGKSPRDDPWMVAIEAPFPQSDSQVLRIELVDAAIATSGPYRNFIVHDGVRRSHIVDPRSGVPVANSLWSVSVVAPTAMQADGWATALLVAGPDAGWALATDQSIAALFVRADESSVHRRATPAFNNHSAVRTRWIEAQP